MKKLLLAMLTIAAFTGAAHADEFTGLTLRAVSNSPIGGGAVLGGTSVSAVTTAYSNVTNFLGSAFANGGATVISGNTITKLVADDLGLKGPIEVHGPGDAGPGRFTPFCSMRPVPRPARSAAIRISPG